MEIHLVIGPEGQGHCLYTEQLDLSSLGEIKIRRASFVETDQANVWWADLGPVNGPRLGPFQWRSKALEAEQAWLESHRLGPSGGQ